MGQLLSHLPSSSRKMHLRGVRRRKRLFKFVKTSNDHGAWLRDSGFHPTFVLETDASGFGLGAVLMQQGHPIAYFSQLLSPRNQLKSIYERELMAMVLAVQKWRHYLLGRHFLINTDQRSLKYLLEQRVVQPEYQKWVAKLIGYDFEIQFKAGVTNKAADALSRINPPSKVSLQTLVSHRILEVQDIKEAVAHDPFLSKVLADLQQGSAAWPHYTLHHGLLLFKSKLVLPKGSPLLQRILFEYHDGALGGHSGFLRTFKRIERDLYWVGMRQDIKRYVAECSICQQHKYQSLSPAGLLQPLPIPQQVWEDVAMDFIEGLPKSNGFSVIFVVVDRLTKYGHFIPLAHPFSAKSVAVVFVREVVRLHGFPRSIVSDRDKVFLSSFWSELFKLQGTRLHHSTAYHPQSDGQSEVVNRCLETYLRCFTSDTPKQWSLWLAWAEFWYNTTFHASTNMTPFKAVYGREPPPIVRYGAYTTAVADLDAQLKTRDVILDELKFHLARAQSKMKATADTHRRNMEFSIGDLVYLKIRPYRQRSLARRPNEKLSPRFFGPFKVLERVGVVAYKLELPPSTSIHPVFHISQLRPVLGSTDRVQPLPASLTDEMEWSVVPAQAAGFRRTERGREVLIYWKDLPTFEATWELVDVIRHQFPEFHLEDKVGSCGDGIDKPPIKLKYSRRHKKHEGTRGGASVDSIN
ncbi:hypothetical protein Syun_014070 [Stephania yunnanensis]|uniref:Integrase catalytic domain-containing protein n=1 Tax=Stephania yunnanensis TaxID=152371 RepID=A0AAP0PBF7_9MAGN